jgi:hypothetical protein
MLRSMSEPAAEVAAEDAPLARAADNARHGVVTHLTMEGQRVAVIMPQAVIDALSAFAEILSSEERADRLPGTIRAAIPWTRLLPADDLRSFAAELSAAAAAGRDAPDLVATVLREWQVTAEAYADPETLAALTTAPVDCGPVPEPVR